jgi:hypothetical protein
VARQGRRTIASVLVHNLFLKKSEAAQKVSKVPAIFGETGIEENSRRTAFSD